MLGGKSISITTQNIIDFESLIFAIIAILISNILSHIILSPVLYIFSIFFAFAPVFVLSFKIVIYLGKKNAFDVRQKSIRLSLLGLLAIAIVFIPITLFNYLSHSYVYDSVVAILICCAFGEKLFIRKRLSKFINPIIKDLLDFKRSYLIYLQAVLFVILSIYLAELPHPVAPIEMDYVHIGMLTAMIIVTSYIVVSNSTLREVSIILTALFLFMFLAIQNVVYEDGDTGLSVSITKYFLNGNHANFVSPNEEWRFGNSALLGFPSLTSYLSEASQVNPEIGISFANALCIIFIFIGGFMFRDLFNGNDVKKSIIFMIYVLAQPAIYLFVVDPLRPSSFLLFVLPLTIPLFLQLRLSNIFGKMCFILGMFAIGIIHPLSFFSIIIMLAYLLLKLSNNRVRIVAGGIIASVLAIIVFTPKALRVLSIHPKGGSEGPGAPSLIFTNKIHDVFFTATVPFSSWEWPEFFSTKFSLAFTLITFLILLFVEVENIPRKPLLAYIVLFYITSSFVNAVLFPIERLSMFVTGIGMLIVTALIIDYLYKHNKFRIDLRIKTMISVSLLSIIIMGVILLGGYTKSRALLLDSSKVEEYKLLKEFVNKEKGNFNNSLILGYVETLRYTAGLDGAILYNNPPKAFNFDFTNASIVDQFFNAYHDSLKGNFTLASKLANSNHVNYVYVVLFISFTSFPK